MAPNTSPAKFSLKLMVHKEEKRVIFAEADNNFIDTLFSILTLPMATIVRLLRKVPDEKLKAITSVNNVYQSLLDLSTNFMSAEENKWMLLNPRTSSHDICRNLKLNINDQEPTKYFICHDFDCSRSSGARFSTCNLARCSDCGMAMDREVKYEEVNSNVRGDGVFVSDLTSYIVTDDLRVMENSPGSIIQLLSELGITDVSGLDEMTFDIGLDQVLTLLKGALLFKYPLTHLVFPSSMINQDLVIPKQDASVKHLTSETSAKYSLKVTMQKSASKFLFAEADSDFVEFLFWFLAIPLGSVIGKLMCGASSFESLNNLYASISNMSVNEYIKSYDLKNMLLQPQLALTHLSKNQIFPLCVFNDSKTYCRTYLPPYLHQTFIASLTRSVSRGGLEKEMFCICALKDSRVDGKYLKTSAKFMLTDDLVITPLSSFSSVTMLGKLKVPLNDVEVVEISIGTNEGLEILDAALKSESALTDSILKKVKETKN